MSVPIRLSSHRTKLRRERTPVGGSRRCTNRLNLARSAGAASPTGIPSGNPRSSSSCPCSPTRLTRPSNTSSHCDRPPTTRPQRATASSTSASSLSIPTGSAAPFPALAFQSKYGERQASTTPRRGSAKSGFSTDRGTINRSNPNNAATAGLFCSDSPSISRTGIPNSAAICPMDSR